ncbi:DMT family transporter [Rhizobium leguminosarum]|uniref:DMT family transporter n=1 Tax=Rhizobium leguminosarum TaxID=384 RepID=UPI0021BBBC3F|nr:EamA family transporter [Rhizobium leguminosarum]
MSATGNLLKFLVLCVVWGLTWIAVKAGVETIPPMLFAATRFIAAGALLLAWSAKRGQMPAPRKVGATRLVIVSLLMITLCYGPLFWGMKFVASGTAAVLEMSLTPLALLAFGMAAGEEHWNAARAGAMLLGVVGLCVLFAPSRGEGNLSDLQSFVGLVAIAWAAISSAWGSVMARPLVSRYGSTTLSGATTLIGGTVLLMLSFAIEPGSLTALSQMWEWKAIAGWLFLVIFGSLIGYSIYVQLLRDIGPAALRSSHPQSRFPLVQFWRRKQLASRALQGWR